MSIISYSIGSLLVGSWFSVAMYGSMSFQAVRFLRMNNDPAPWLRILVSVLWLLDTLHVIFICHSLYFFLITSQATEPNVHLIPWSLAATVAVTAAITLIVQLFFARRIWILSRELRLVVVLIAATAVTRVVFACITTSRAIIIGNLPDFAPLVPFLVTTGLTLSVVTDLLVTGALCWYLSRQRTGFETDSLIDKIMRWTVQNGAMTSFFAIVSLVTAVIMPHNLVWLGIHLIISKCYTTSTIAHLNAKEVERELRMQHAELNHGLHLPRNNSYSAGSKNAERSANGPVVTVSKDVFVEISEKGHDRNHSIGNKSSNDSLTFNAV